MGKLSQPTWLVDTDTSCLVFFFHGRPIKKTHKQEVGPFQSPNGFWRIHSVKVSELNRPLKHGGDAVNIVKGTSVQHIKKPAGADHIKDLATGEIAELSGPGINAKAYPNGGADPVSATVSHKDGHVDQYTLMVNAAVRGANIHNYQVSITGHHLGPVKKIEKKKRR